MAMLDYGRLLKILGMTTSTSDGEALNAIRLANKILAEAKVGWAQVIKVGAQNNTAAYAEEIFRAATENARNNRWAEAERYAADFNTDKLRKKQAERDKQYERTYEYRTGYEDPEMTGWSTKGPFDFGSDGSREGSMGSKPQVDDVLQAELDADEMSRDLPDEQQQANFYVFAVVEPKLARFLHDNKNGAMLFRVLYRTVCETGDISEAQQQVLRQRMGR